MTQQDSSSNENFPSFMILVLLMLGVAVLSFLIGPNSSISGVQAAARPTSTPTAIPPTRTPLPTLTPIPTDTPTPLPTITPVPTDTPLPPTEAPAGSSSAAGTGDYDPALVSAGETLFLASCSACHGADARGIPNLGKDLVASEFVAGLTDDEVVTFVTTGRPIWDPLNTTGIDMPPRGGNPALANDDIYAIVAYIRVLSDSVGGGASGDASQSTGDDGGSAGTSDYDPALVSAGETLFLASCSACHGADARGIPNLGKDLVVSEFVAGLTDDELVTFVTTGRPLWDPLNTTGIDMPPRGGNPALANDDIHAIVAYIRVLSDSGGGGASGDAPQSTGDDGGSAGTSDYDPALVSAGETLFLAACSACHGADARGIPNLGKDLVASEFVAGLTDDEVVTFVTTGRPIWDPLNTTGIDMPPRGGNPALANDDIYAIVAYIRSLTSP